MNALNASLLAAGLVLAAAATSAEAPEEEGFVAEFVTPEAGDAALESAPVPATEEMPAVAETPAVEEIVTEAGAGETPSFEAEFDTGPVLTEAVTEIVTDVDADTVIAEPSVIEAEVEPESAAVEPAYVDTVAAEAAAEEAERRREALKALRGPYIGISGGTDHVSITGINDGTTAGLMFGYRINEMLSAEFALNSGTYDAATLLAPTCAVDSLTTGVFAAARSNGPFYLKGRIGVLSETLESGGGCAGISLDDAGISAGVGAGMRLGRAAVEFEYTQVEKEIYRLGWTLLLNF